MKAIGKEFQPSGVRGRNTERVDDGKSYHVVGIGISINGSGVAGEAAGIGLYTTTKTIFEVVERSDISMILVPNHGRQGIGLPRVKAALDPTE